MSRVLFPFEVESQTHCLWLMAVVVLVGGGAGAQEEIFEDGFESGTRCAWSGGSPLITRCEKTFSLPGGAPLTMVRIPAGTFLMGAYEDEQNASSDEYWQHQVTLTHDYAMGKYEVTQEQWQAVFGNNPSYFPSCGGDCPVETVSWWEAAAFANAVSDFFDVERCYTLTGCVGAPGEGMECTGATFVGVGCDGYRLPTEAEWERAARAGTQTRFSHGDVPGGPPACDDLCGACDQHDQFMVWCGNDDGRYDHVGSKDDNGWGLHDMHGNVQEWVSDLWGLYSADPVQDPTGPASGSGRVRRGGSYQQYAHGCRSALRRSESPGVRALTLGFRLARGLNHWFPFPRSR